MEEKKNFMKSQGYLQPEKLIVCVCIRCVYNGVVQALLCNHGSDKLLHWK